MKNSRSRKIGVFLIISILFKGNLNNSPTFVTAQPGLFGATITPEKFTYVIYEDIIATFNFSSHITAEDYFTCALAADISFNSIIETEPIQGNFSISLECRFSLLSVNYSYQGDQKIFYLLLYYYNDVFGNEICCSEQIILQKAELTCKGPSNYTEIKQNSDYFFNFHFYDPSNISFVLVMGTVTCIFKMNNQYSNETNFHTNQYGVMSISVRVNNFVGFYDIDVIVDSNRYFRSLKQCFRFNVTDVFSFSPKPPKLRIYLTMSAVSLGLSAVCAFFIYYCITVYKKKIKTRYQIKNLKI
ncbi:MAG: hypothetical protein JW776_02795 [Candidatus Lokiarchaeota archaeon]|nr:hypothetical protein [Candidatus Lokiarchaeota archaeon]